MVTTLSDEPSVQIMDLIETNFDTSNTVLSSAPRFSTGWYDYKNDRPQISFTETDSQPINGGVTGYSHISSNNGGGQVISGNVDANSWAIRNDSGNNPKQVTWQLSEEIRRIVTDNQFSINDFNLFLSVERRTRFPPETEQTPPVYRINSVISFGFISNPD